jgi:hypothetical protein
LSFLLQIDWFFSPACATGVIDLHAREDASVGNSGPEIDNFFNNQQKNRELRFVVAV